MPSPKNESTIKKMTHAEIADGLEGAVNAWEKLSKSKQTRDSLAFQGVNNGIRKALQALDDEDPSNIEHLERRGLWTGHYDEPIPDTFIPGVRQLITELREA